MSNLNRIRAIYVGEIERTPDSPDHLGIKQGGKEFKEFLILDPVLHTADYNMKMVQSFKPDIVLHGNTDSLGQGLAAKFKQATSAKQAFLMYDYQPNIENYAWNQWASDLRAYDAVFLSNRDQLDEWGRRFGCSAHYATHGCVTMKMGDDKNLARDVIFIGSHTNGGWYKDRYELIEEITKLYPIEIYTGSEVEGRNKVWREMPSIYHMSNCVLDISHSWTADGYASGRYFYAAGLGGCSIARRFPGCEDLYPEGTKLYFETAEEACKLILKYKKNSVERERIKKKAWNWNKKYHNYKIKFQDIINKTL